MAPWSFGFCPSNSSAAAAMVAMSWLTMPIRRLNANEVAALTALGAFQPVVTEVTPLGRPPLQPQPLLAPLESTLEPAPEPTLSPLPPPLPPPQPMPPPLLISDLIRSKTTNFNTLIFELAYVHRTELLVADALLEDGETFWHDGSCTPELARLRRIAPGVLGAVSHLEGAISAGLRMIGRDRDVSVYARATHTTRDVVIDMMFAYRNRNLVISVRQKDDETLIALRPAK